MKETFYFSHDYNARSDEKIIKLISKEGLEGYGIFWILIEKLYEADGWISQDYEGIAFDIRTDCERIKRVVENYGLFVVSKEKIHSNSVLARLRRRKGKSELARQSANLRWHKPNSIDANAMRTQCDSNAIKESKVKESKSISKDIAGVPAGNTLINSLITSLKEKQSLLSLDESEKINRQYAHLLIKHKLTPQLVAENKAIPQEAEILQAFGVLVSKLSPFQKQQATNFKYFYYNFNKILNN